jgi:Coenzyme PQQ synthesis protein D (PqqD)
MDSIEVRLDVVYVLSGDIVAREIEGEVIIVPLVAGIGDMEDELYTLNETGKAVWDKLDGERTLATIVAALTAEYSGERDEIQRDVVGLVGELLKRRIVVAG